LRVRQFAQWRRAFALKIFRECPAWFAFEPEAQFAERRVERLAQRQQRRATHRALRVPHDVQDDILKCGIAIMSVRAPAAGAEVHFHVAGAHGIVADLHHGTTKIRSTFDAAKTRMKQAHALTVQRRQLLATQALVLPDGLEQALGWRVVVVAQHAGDPGAQTPLRIEIGGQAGHRTLLLRRWFCKVKRRGWNAEFIPRVPARTRFTRNEFRAPPERYAAEI